MQEGTDCPARNFSLSPISYVFNFPMNLLSVRKLTKSPSCFVKFFPSYSVLQDLSTKKAIGGGRKANEVYHRIGPPLAPIALHTSFSSTQ